MLQFFSFATFSETGISELLNVQRALNLSIKYFSTVSSDPFKGVFSSNGFRKSIFFFIFSKIRDLRIVYQKDLFYYGNYVKKVKLNLSLFFIGNFKRVFLKTTFSKLVPTISKKLVDEF